MERGPSITVRCECSSSAGAEVSLLRPGPSRRPSFPLPFSPSPFLLIAFFQTSSVPRSAREHTAASSSGSTSRRARNTFVSSPVLESLGSITNSLLRTCSSLSFPGRQGVLQVPPPQAGPPALARPVAWSRTRSARKRWGDGARWGRTQAAVGGGGGGEQVRKERGGSAGTDCSRGE